MSILYPLYYKQLGIRRVQNMLAPKLFDFGELPRNTIVHHASFDQEHKDIDTSLLYLKNYNKKILIDVPEYYDERTQPLGNPKRKAVIVRSLLRDFLKDNSEFRYLKDHYKVVNDPLTLLINNYSYLDEIYRYVEIPMTVYYRWINTQKTIWSDINTISTGTDRNSFIFMNIPADLPSYTLLNIYSVKTNVTMLKVFDTPEKLFILELWKWLNPETRSTSVISSLDDQSLSRVTIVFNTPNNKSCLLNLGYLNSWIKGNENVTEFSNITQFKFTQIQLLLLKFILTLQSSIPEEIIEDEEIKQDKPVDNTLTPSDVKEDNTDIKTDTKEIDYNPTEIDYKSSNLIKNLIKKDINTTTEPEIQNEESSHFDFTKQFNDINKDLSLLETISKRKLSNKGIVINKDGDEIEKELVSDRVITVEEARASIYEDKPTDTILKDLIDNEAEIGSISASEYKKILKDVENYKQMKDPYGSDQTVGGLSVIKPEELKLDSNKITITASENVLDKSMLTSSLLSFNSDYVNNVMKKDILAMLGTLQKAGVIIKRHEMELDNSALGSYEIHTLELKPINGANSIVRFRIPKVNEDGIINVNGNKAILRLQRIDAPIRKISPTIVALTSYYGKTFVNLDDKKANNSVEWIAKQVNKASMEIDDYITKVDPANVFDNSFKAPYIYNALANKYKLIETKNYTLLFDHTERHKLVDKDLLSLIEKDGSRLIGYTSNKEPLVINIDNVISVYVNENNITPVGNIYDVLGLSEQKSPVDFTTIRIFSKTIPVVIVLGYLVGITNLLKSLDVKYRVVPSKSFMQLQKDEYTITFKDEIYIFSRKDKVASLIISGLLEFEKELKKYSFTDLDQKDIYFLLLKYKGLGSIYVREIGLLDQLFVDSITKDILIEMNEPTTFRGLLIRATELLTTYHHPSSQDLNSMRIRGYERIPGIIYKELAVAIRQHQNKNISNKSKIDISPFQIWSKIMKDPAMKLVEDTNPIQNLKETEIVTYLGEGGRGKDSMNKKSRAYQNSDMGVISEATVDSSDVGINAYLSANPSFSSLRGMVKQDKNYNPTNLLSTSALLGAFSVNDDAKRVNFLNIQNSHLVAAEGYRQGYVRTGYEYVLPNRTTDMFAFTAKGNGKVISKNNNGIIIEYEDGKQKGITLGRVYGKAEGSVYPHDIVSNLSIGDTFVKGDIISYNTGFFESDILDPNKVVLKGSMYVKVALLESNQTFEDSSAISDKISSKLRSSTTKVKSIVVNFNQNLLNIVKVGQTISPDDILMIIEDEITSTTSAFDEESLAVLKKLSNQAPKSKYEGIVDRIEVLYHGDKADMSPTLKSLADRSDRLLADISRSSGKAIISGRVNDEYRVGGNPLIMDTAEIKIFITIKTDSGIGDKIIFGNQLKSVIGEVMNYTVTTETGQDIEAIFGFRSILARVVESPIIIGTTATLLKTIANKAIEIYNEEK